MNRGRGRRPIFPGQTYFETFLSTLDEAHQRFGFEILCYCLLSNHYHLLVKTPEGNLGRIMRHINGVYTQRYNRMKKTDGPLFRGRYKAILVEEDSYQLQLSRYIHRNPLEAGMVGQLEQYPWSSYHYYLGKMPFPDWLYPDDVLAQLGSKRNVAARYKAYVEMGVDQEIQQFYGKDNLMPYLGSDDFRAWAYSQKQTDDESVSGREKSSFRPSMEKIIGKVAQAFNVTTQSVRVARRGVQNVPRWVAMYLCQETGGHRLCDIAKTFGLNRTGSIPTTIGKMKERMGRDKALRGKVNSAI